MTTNIYFVRHAESKYTPKDDDFSRPLSEKGKEDVEKVTKLFKDLDISKVLSSPYVRAVHTVESLAKDKGLEVELVEDFRERTVSSEYLDHKEFKIFVESQWNDFDYSMEGGESLKQVQERGIKSLKEVLQKNSDNNIMIGTHGTWLGAILNYFDKKHNYEFWKSLKMPDIFLLKFEDGELKLIEHIEI